MCQGCGAVGQIDPESLTNGLDKLSRKVIVELVNVLEPLDIVMRPVLSLMRFSPSVGRWFEHRNAAESELAFCFSGSGRPLTKRKAACRRSTQESDSAVWPPALEAFRSDLAKQARLIDLATDPRNGCLADGIRRYASSRLSKEGWLSEQRHPGKAGSKPRGPAMVNFLRSPAVQGQ